MKKLQTFDEFLNESRDIKFDMKDIADRINNLAEESVVRVVNNQIISPKYKNAGQITLSYNNNTGKFTLSQEPIPLPASKKERNYLPAHSSQYQTGIEDEYSYEELDDVIKETAKMCLRALGQSSKAMKL